MSAALLEATQRWMHDALIFPRRAEPDAVAETLVANGPLSAAGGLAIYQRGYFLRIAACMREQFPALTHALGEPLFDDFVADYIRELPPESYTLHDLGRRFAGWMEGARPDRDAPPEEREPWFDFMVELARFERQIFTLFDGPGHEGRPLATADTPDAALRLQPAFALGAYRYPVHAYYHVVRDCGDAPLPPLRQSHVALVRTDYLTRTIPLSAPHHRFLSAMTEGGSVEDAIGATAAFLGVSSDAVRASWQAPESARGRWIAWGFFAAMP